MSDNELLRWMVTAQVFQVWLCLIWFTGWCLRPR
jgi:hypothetical protein